MSDVFEAVQNGLKNCVGGDDLFRHGFAVPPSRGLPSLKTVHWTVFQALRPPEGEGFWKSSLPLQGKVAFAKQMSEEVGSLQDAHSRQHPCNEYSGTFLKSDALPKRGLPALESVAQEDRTTQNEIKEQNRRTMAA